MRWARNYQPPIRGDARMTTPPSDGPADPGDPRALLAVLGGLRAIAEGRLSGLAIAQDEYLADIYCIQRVANLLAMELSALGRTLRREQTRAGAAEMEQIEDILARAFEAAGLSLDDCYLDLAESAVRPGKPAAGAAVIAPLGDERDAYPLGGLSERDLDADPIRQFAAWFERARAGGAADPHAVTLATATTEGVPSARLVLLRGFDERGFVFFSNYDSRKGRELAQNPNAALVCYWPELRRQVRIAGTVERTTRAESEAYFRGRPLESRLGAWASPQSAVIASRDVLDERVRRIAAEYRDRDIPCPPFWGGFRLVPHIFEFWQSRPNRLHDRFRYTRQADGGWRIERLAP